MLEICTGTLAGELVVHDARSGMLLWRVGLGHSSILAAVTAHELNGDGVLDLIVADQERQLSAFSGRSAVMARGR